MVPAAGLIQVAEKRDWRGLPDISSLWMRPPIQIVGVQQHLDELKRFWRHEVSTLAKARKATGYRDWPVPQYERDLVFLSYKAGVTSLQWNKFSPAYVSSTSGVP